MSTPPATPVLADDVSQSEAFRAGARAAAALPPMTEQTARKVAALLAADLARVTDGTGDDGRQGAA